MNYLIDSQGQWHRWPSMAMAAAAGYPDPDFDFPDYATRNLGYVAVQVADEATYLQFRAGMLGPAVLPSLRSFLARAIIKKPVGLVFLAAGWLEEAYLQAGPLLARFDELAAYREPRLREPFISRRREPRDWGYTAHHSLRDLLDVWRFSEGVYSGAARRYLENTGLMARTIFLAADDTRTLQVLSSGSGFTIYNAHSLTGTIGRRIDDQPDRAYGRWVEQFYIDCWRTGTPLLDDVDALIAEPGFDLRRRRYQRLILRWSRPGGGTLLTGSSMLNQHIPIALDSMS